MSATGKTKDKKDGYLSKGGKGDKEILLAANHSHVKNLSEMIEAEAELEMGSGKIQVTTKVDSTSNLHDNYFFKPMTPLEKEWEFIIVSNDVDQVKKFLDEHPFVEDEATSKNGGGSPSKHNQNSPTRNTAENSKLRFVNYRSKIDGNTVLHYAAQRVNVNLAVELIKNRGVDASIVNNSGMTPLHLLAQCPLDPNEAEVKKITIARLLLLPSIKKSTESSSSEADSKVLLPTLCSPYTRDHFGRRACDLLPPEHVNSMRIIFRANVPDIKIGPKHKEKDNSAVKHQGGGSSKPSFLEQIFGQKSSSKQVDPNLASNGIPSSSQMAGLLPGGALNRTQSIRPYQIPTSRLMSHNSSFKSSRKVASSVFISPSTAPISEEKNEDASANSTH